MIWDQAGWKWRNYRVERASKPVGDYLAVNAHQSELSERACRCGFHVCNCSQVATSESVEWLKIADVDKLPDGSRVRCEAVACGNPPQFIGELATRRRRHELAFDSGGGLCTDHMEAGWRFSIVEAEKKLLTVEDVRALPLNSSVRVAAASGEAELKVGDIGKYIGRTKGFVVIKIDAATFAACDGVGLLFHLVEAP